MSFFKVLVPLVLLSGSAYAEEAKKADDKMVAEAPAAPKAKKCATNIKEMEDSLQGNGYHTLITLWDTDKPYISRQFMYNVDHNDMVVMSLVYDKEKFYSDKEPKPVKICREFAGGKIDYDGNVFKSFVLGQVMKARQSDVDEAAMAHKKHQEEEGNK